MAAEQILMSSGRPTAQPPFHDCALSKMRFYQATAASTLEQELAPKAPSLTVTNDESGENLKSLKKILKGQTEQFKVQCKFVSCELNNSISHISKLYV